MPDPIMQKLDEMQARCDAATEGPWESDGGEVAQHWSLPEPWKQVVSGHVSCMAYCYGGSCWPIEREADSDFITASRTDMPRLIAALKAVVEEHYPNGAQPDCNCCSPTCACGHWAYPCPTVEAVAEALGVDDA